MRINGTLLLFCCGLLVACTSGGGKSADAVTSNGNGRLEDGSFISECLSGVRLVATFSPEGDFVDEYKYTNDSCVRKPVKTRLISTPKALGAPVQGKLKISVSNYRTAAFDGTSVDVLRSNDLHLQFHVKWSGQCVERDGRKTSACWESYNYLSPSRDNFAHIETDGFFADASASRMTEGWITSGMYRTDWRKQCSKIEKITVGAGRFETCFFENADFKIWFGTTPLFQVVKFENKTGARLSDLRTGSIYIGFRLGSAKSYELSEVAY